MKKAAFLDRDGVLVKNIDGDYIRNISQIQLLPNAKDAISKLYNSGFHIVIVTNQAAVGKGLMSYDDAKVVQSEIEKLLDPNKSMNIKSEICPHTDSQECKCRKPAPGMVLNASKKYALDLRNSYMIGDALSDIQAALNAKIKPVMVLSGRGKRSDIKAHSHRVRVFNHVGEAADYICESSA